MFGIMRRLTYPASLGQFSWNVFPEVHFGFLSLEINVTEFRELRLCRVFEERIVQRLVVNVHLPMTGTHFLPHALLQGLPSIFLCNRTTDLRNARCLNVIYRQREWDNRAGTYVAKRTVIARHPVSLGDIGVYVTSDRERRRCYGEL